MIFSCNRKSQQSESLQLMPGSRNFHHGGPGPFVIVKTALTTLFIFQSSTYITEWLILKETITVQGLKVTDRVQHIPGGTQIFPWRGVQCLFPLKPHIAFEFPCSPDPNPLLWIRACSSSKKFGTARFLLQ